MHFSFYQPKENELKPRKKNIRKKSNTGSQLFLFTDRVSFHERTQYNYETFYYRKIYILLFRVLIALSWGTKAH